MNKNNQIELNTSSLNFAVRLEPSQPAPEVMEEMFEVLGFSLHHPSVTQPVEYFHSLLLSYYDLRATTLWAIQEEDPAKVRYVTDDGIETVSPRFAGTAPPDDIASFLDEFQNTLMAKQSECRECEFWERCGGYFKWPRREFAYDGVKAVFQTLREAADELREDIAAYSEPV